MYTLLIIVTIIICLLLAIVVLIQNPKGGGLDASFGGVSSNTFGAARTTDFLEKSTWILAISLVVISMISAMAIGRGTSISADDIIKESNMPASTTSPEEKLQPATDIKEATGVEPIKVEDVEVKTETQE